jgi:hypothetical protein
MTFAELKQIVEDLESYGTEDDTPVHMAIQPTYPLVSTVKNIVAVEDGEMVYEDNGREYFENTGHISGILILEGSQVHDTPYGTDAETFAMDNADWAMRRG